MIARSGAIVVVVAVLAAAQVLAVGEPLLSIEVFLFSAVIAWGDVRVGAWPRWADLVWAALLMVPLALLDLALLWAIFAPLSYWAPAFVEATVFGTPEPLWYRTDRSSVANGFAALALVLVAPVVEETVFRGWLLPAWSRRWGMRTALVATSLVFGLLHGMTALGGCVFGVVAGLLYLRSGSFAVSIVAHATMNAIAASGDLLGGNRDSELSGTALLETFRSAWWMAGVGLTVGAPVIGWFVWRHWSLVERREEHQDATVSPPGA